MAKRGGSPAEPKVGTVPLDVAVQDTYLALVTKAVEWKRGGGIQLGLSLFSPDGTKVPHLNGNGGVETRYDVPQDGPKFVACALAIFPEATEIEADLAFDLDDLLERWVYVKFERDRKRDENEGELAQWGPRLNVAMMTAIPPGERAAVKAIHERVVGKPMKTLAPPVVPEDGSARP